MESDLEKPKDRKFFSLWRHRFTRCIDNSTNWEPLAGSRRFIYFVGNVTETRQRYEENSVPFPPDLKWDIYNPSTRGQVWNPSRILSTGSIPSESMKPWIPNRRSADTPENRMRSSARYSNKANKRMRGGRKNGRGRKGRKREEEGTRCRRMMAR